MFVKQSLIVLSSCALLSGCSDDSSKANSSQAPDPYVEPANTHLRLGDFEGTSGQRIDVEVFDTASGPLWHVDYTGQVANPNGDRRGLSVGYWRSDSALGKVDLETSAPKNPDGMVEPAEVLYWERPASKDVWRVWYKAVAGRIVLERSDKDSLRLVIDDLELGTAHQEHPELIVVLDEDAGAEPLMRTVEVNGEYTFICSLADSGSFCDDNAL